MKKIILFLSTAFLLASCNDTPDRETDVLPAQSYEFVADSIVYKNGPCETTESNCYVINWQYYKLIDTTDFSEYVNHLIRKSVALNLEPKTGSELEVDSLIRSMQKDHTQFMEEFPESGISTWFDESETTILNNDSTLISLEVFNANYYGGAHPNSFTIYLNFVPNKNEVLKVGDIFKNIDKVTEIVESEFRVERELSPEIDLNEEGFFLENGKFFLPEGIGFTAEEVIFHYNPYEIGPYVFGNTEVRISREELKDYLKI